MEYMGPNQGRQEEAHHPTNELYNSLLLDPVVRIFKVMIIPSLFGDSYHYK